MKTIDLTKFCNEGFILYFGGDSEKISAISFCKALYSLIQATEFIGDMVRSESNHNIEISVKSVKPGSLSVTLGVVAVGGVSASIISQVLSGYILYKLTSREIKVEVDEVDGKVTNELEIEETIDKYGSVEQHEILKILMDSDAANLLKVVKSNSKFNRDMKKSFRTMLDEPHIGSFHIRDFYERKKMVDLQRSKFETVINNISRSEKEDLNYKDIETVLRVRIPVLDKSPRRWEFVMNDRKIMATISDHTFFTHLESGRVSIRQGDEFIVTLRIFGYDERYEVKKIHNIVNSRS